MNDINSILSTVLGFLWEGLLVWWEPPDSPNSPSLDWTTLPADCPWPAPGEPGVCVCVCMCVCVCVCVSMSNNTVESQ